MSLPAPTRTLVSAGCLAVAITMVLTVPAALASDGALEIHQACVATGCFPGDSPGFPVEIATRGSYVLTSNLDVSNENTTAILLLADHVRVDLGGFTISGVVDCGVNTSDPCTPAATNASGIDGSGVNNSSAANGTIRGMGGFGVQLGSDSRVEGVDTSHNGFDGIALTGGGIVRNCTSRRNGRNGIDLSTESVVTGNIASRNNRHGIEDGGRSSFRDNTANENAESGILIGRGSIAIGNSLNANVRAGLVGDDSAGYGHNTLLDNSTGTPAAQVTGEPTQVGPNLCAAVACP